MFLRSILVIFILSSISAFASNLKEREIIIYRNEEALSYSMPVTRVLSKLHPELAKGVVDTRFYSATQGVEVIHNISKGKLNFITPTETELKGDFDPGYTYKYVATSKDKTSNCFKYLGWGGDSFNPVWESQRNVSTYRPHGICSYHPMIFEGKTLEGKPFKIHWLMSMDKIPQPASYSVSTRSFAEVTLDGTGNYAVVDSKHPLVIKIQGDWEFTRNLTLKTEVKGKMHNLATNLINDKDNKTFVLKTENIPTNKPFLLNFYSYIKYKSNPANPKALNDTAGYYLYVFPASCIAYGTDNNKTNKMKYALMSCKSTLGDKSVEVTQRSVVYSDGSIFFDNVPNAKCDVISWDLANNPRKVKMDYTCTEGYTSSTIADKK